LRRVPSSKVDTEFEGISRKVNFRPQAGDSVTLELILDCLCLKFRYGTPKNVLRHCVRKFRPLECRQPHLRTRGNGAPCTW
jgi:hypothetical protein